MAIITPSQLVSEIRGSIGDKTFSRNHYRAYVKARVAPTDTPSSYKTTARQNMTDCVAAWQALSSGQQLLWSTVAENFYTKSRLGSQHKMGGFNHFIKHNILRLQCELSITDSPKNPVELPRSVFTNMFWGNGEADFRITRKPTSLSLKTLLYMSPPVNASVLSVNSTQLLFMTYQGSFNGTNTYDFTSFFEARFGATTDFPGMRCFGGYRIFDPSSGTVSPMMIKSSISL